MKRMIASAGLVALGAAGVSAAGYTPGFASVDMSKPWSISATLRGFYDDNYATASSGSDLKRDSYGFEVRPGASVSFSEGQTDAGLRYTYSMRYYQDRADRGVSSADHSHEVMAVLNHKFTERYSLAVSDSFVIAQEPELLTAGQDFSLLQRADGNNMRNLGTIGFQAQVTSLLGVQLDYANTYYDYENKGGDATTPSLSGLLDRIEHLGTLELRWQALPQAVGIFGYKYGQVDYTSGEEVAIVDSTPMTSKIRNNRSHYGYAGAEYNFSPDLTGSVRGGVQYVDYYNDPSNGSSVGPYVLASLKYVYTTRSSLEVGFKHGFNATDLISSSGVSVTEDAESSVAFASINHQITPQLTGSLQATYQHSAFNGGLYDSKTEDFIMAGVNFAYRLNPHLSAEVGYNYDRVESDIPGRSYPRNRVYVGVTASY